MTPDPTRRLRAYGRARPPSSARDVYAVGARPGPGGPPRPLRLGIAGCGGIAQAKWLPAIRRLQTIGEPIDSRRRDRSRRGAARARSRPSGAPGLRQTLDDHARARRPRPRCWCWPPTRRMAPSHRRRSRRACRASWKSRSVRTLAEARALCDTAERHGVLLAGGGQQALLAALRPRQAADRRRRPARAARGLHRQVHARLPLCRPARGRHDPPARSDALAHGTGRSGCMPAPLRRTAGSRARSSSLALRVGRHRHADHQRRGAELQALGARRDDRPARDR